MKKSYWILLAMAVILATGNSCTREEPEGALQLGIQLTGEDVLKSGLAVKDVTAALVTVADADGYLVCDKEYLPIYAFGDTYTTRTLKLPVGNFRLEQFMLVDSLNQVLWATPRTGSALAHLVSGPLPVPFGIRSDQTTTLHMEVVHTGEYQPSDFGYASFEIRFVERFCLSIYYSTRCLEEWNDSILGPDGSGAPVYLPMLSIWNGNRMVLHEPLNPGLNRYQVPLLDDIYALEATDCHGQTVFQEKLSLRQLLQHLCEDNYPPLMISRDTFPDILVTPEGLTEPSIKQGVFGQISVEVDSMVISYNMSQVSLVRDIYYYPYNVMDSIMSFAPIDCYFPIQLIQEEPLAVVRSNSEGVYQVPLEAGEYLYLVKEGDRYYWEVFVSSHPPGHVEVFVDNITERNIYIVDCSMWMQAGGK
jgi:hypothetical protein